MGVGLADNVSRGAGRHQFRTSPLGVWGNGLLPTRWPPTDLCSNRGSREQGFRNPLTWKRTLIYSSPKRAGLLNSCARYRHSQRLPRAGSKSASPGFPLWTRSLIANNICALSHFLVYGAFHSVAPGRRGNHKSGRRLFHSPLAKKLPTDVILVKGPGRAPAIR